MRVLAVIITIAFLFIAIQFFGNPTGEVTKKVYYQDETPSIEIIFPADRQIVASKSFKMLFQVFGPEISECGIFIDQEAVTNMTDIVTNEVNSIGVDLPEGEHDFYVSCTSSAGISGVSETRQIRINVSAEPPERKQVDQPDEETPEMLNLDFLNLEDNFMIYVVVAVIWVAFMVVVLKFRPKVPKEEKTMEYVPLEPAEQPPQQPAQPPPDQPPPQETPPEQPTSQPSEQPPPEEPQEKPQEEQPPKQAAAQEQKEPEPVVIPTSELSITIDEPGVEYSSEQSKLKRLYHLLRPEKRATKVQKEMDEEAEKLEDELVDDYVSREEKYLKDKVKNIILSEVSSKMPYIEKEKSKQLQLMNLLSVKIDKAFASSDVSKIIAHEKPEALKIIEILKIVKPKLLSDWKKIHKGL